MGPVASKLGITAITLTTPNIESAEIGVLVNEFRTAAKSKGNSELFDKSDVDLILKKLEKLEASDLELFNRLFTLFDIKGDGTVNYKDYLAGIAGCIVTGKLNDRLKLAISVYDDNNASICLKGEVKRALHSINNVASYFGDPVMMTSEVDEVVLQLFEAVPKVVGQYRPHEPVIEFLVANETVQSFVKGEGKARFGLMEPAAA